MPLPTQNSLPMVRRVPRLGISDLAEFQNSPYTKQWVVNERDSKLGKRGKLAGSKYIELDEKNGNLKSCQSVGFWENGENNYKASKISGKTIQLLHCFHQIRSFFRRRSEKKVQQFVEILETSTERDGNPSIKTQSLPGSMKETSPDSPNRFFRR